MGKKSRFLEAFKVELSPFHRAKLKLVDDFNYSDVLRKVNRDLGGLTLSYLKEGEFALKQYYAIALLDPLNEHAVSKYVDPFWHSHVLFSQSYMSFCTSIFGGYVHHSPLDPDDIQEVKRIAKLYQYTVATFDKMFSDLNTEWWPSDPTNNTGLGRPEVCLHMLIKEPEIMKHAYFKKQRR